MVRAGAGRAGVSLEIERGECVALLGPNGAGKSTLLDIVLGLQGPDRGAVQVCGLAPVQAVAAGHIGAMLQQGAPIGFLRVRELVAMMAALYPRPRPVDEVLELLELDDLARRSTERLSGGQAQRLRAACILVTGADLLVLDEPTVGLDVESRRGFWSAVRVALHEGATVVFATHYLDEADANADRVVLLAGGRVVADGPATEIRARAATRTIRLTLPRVEVAGLAALDGVVAAERHGDTVTIAASDADRVVRRLLAEHLDARDLEVRVGGLEEAFLALTGEGLESGGEAEGPGRARRMRKVA
ncbi:MAG: ABC transporter ATP-binding protein [Acidimicrobiales bacterium]